MIPTPCRFGLHAWGKWSEPFETIGGRVLQQRRCSGCNRAGTTTDWAPFEAPAQIPENLTLHLNKETP